MKCALACALMLALGLPALAQETPWSFEAGLGAGRIEPKFRQRNGTPDLDGSQVFSRDLDAEDALLRPGLSLDARRGAHRLGLAGWGMSSSSDGVLPAETAFDGRTFPAGTEVSSDIDYLHLQADWEYTFRPRETVRIGTGVSLEYMRFAADYSIGSSDLQGVYPTPKLRLAWLPAGGWEVEALLGGFNVPFENGDTDIVKPYETQLTVRKRWAAYSVEAGYSMYHVHLEKYDGDSEDEIVHLRLRGFYAAAGVRF